MVRGSWARRSLQPASVDRQFSGRGIQTLTLGLQAGSFGALCWRRPELHPGIFAQHVGEPGGVGRQVKASSFFFFFHRDAATQPLLWSYLLVLLSRVHRSALGPMSRYWAPGSRLIPPLQPAWDRKSFLCLARTPASSPGHTSQSLTIFGLCNNKASIHH